MTPSNEKDADALQELLQNSASQLGEHFDSVRIIATKQYGDSDDFVRFSNGSGNWYASLGAVREWITAQDEKLRISERKKAQE